MVALDTGSALYLRMLRRAIMFSMTGFPSFMTVSSDLLLPHDMHANKVVPASIKELSLIGFLFCMNE
jgi:hypothetical protein